MLKLVIETSEDPVLVTDPSGLVVLASSAAARILPSVSPGASLIRLIPGLELNLPGMQHTVDPLGNPLYLWISQANDFRVVRFRDPHTSLDQGERRALSLFKEMHHISLELAKAPTLNDLYRQAVELGRLRIGFDRLAVFLYDRETETVRGTWGTDEFGAMNEESTYSYKLTETKPFIQEALKNLDYVHVWERTELTQWNRPVGTGWNALAFLYSADQPIGWIAADNLLNHKPLLPIQKELLGQFSRTLSNLILRKRYELDLARQVTEKTLELQRREHHFRTLSETLTEQNAMKEKLFTILAHDLRGPIGNSSTILDLAVGGQMTPEELERVLPDMKKSLDNTYGLLENVLEWVRGQMDEINVLRERLEIRRILDTVTGWLNPLAEKKKIVLKTECPDTLSILADSRVVETILRNLISNAIKFTPVGTPVKIYALADKQEETIRISVEDHGVGMSSEAVERLFKIGDKTRSVGTSGEKGSGLGLIFCHELAQRMGGQIEVVSAKGQGSTFTLVVPDVIDEEL